MAQMIRDKLGGGGDGGGTTKDSSGGLISPLVQWTCLFNQGAMHFEHLPVFWSGSSNAAVLTRGC